jgi:ribosomal protein L37AE/L43A
MAETDKKDSSEQSKSDSKGNECPECGEPIDDLRASCKECGYEYKDSDYTDEEAGNEFLSGSNIDDEGEEITDSGPGAEKGAE